MKLSKKLAQDFNTDRNSVIEKVDEETFWVSNTYTAVKLHLYDFVEFREKWNNYKSTKDIPKEFKVIKISNGELTKHEEPVMETVISGNLSYKLKITEEVIAKVGKLGVRKLVSHDIGTVYMGQEYEYIITEFEGCDLYTAKQLKPIHILLDGHLKAMIMPVIDPENNA